MIFEYISDLLDWCKVKIFLARKPIKSSFRDGEIWWCHVGMNVGMEIFGKGEVFERPVLIFKKLDKSLFFGIPLTTQQKDGNQYVPVVVGGRNVRAVLSQARTFDSRRLINKVGELGSGSFLHVRQTFVDFYGQ